MKSAGRIGEAKKNGGIRRKKSPAIPAGKNGVIPKNGGVFCGEFGLGGRLSA